MFKTAYPMKNSKFNLNWLLLLLALPLFVNSCKKENDPTPDPDPEPQNIVEIASGNDNFSTLVSALQRVDLVSVLEGDGPFTVFAPTNAAFSALGVDLNAISDEDLTEILLYHVLAARVASGDIATGQTYATTAATTGPDNNQLSLLIEKSGADVMINGNANVTTADITATNGVIHAVDAVLLPLDLVGHASANSAFTELVGALEAADGDLVSVLQGDGPFTVFAPLNSAFEEIEDVTATLGAEQLAKVLTYHVLAGNVRSTALSDGMEVTTVNTGTFTVNLGNEVTITDSGGNLATVVLTDVQATNGVIHVIDKVILPNNL